MVALITMENYTTDKSEREFVHNGREYGGNRGGKDYAYYKRTNRPCKGTGKLWSFFFRHSNALVIE